MKTKFTINQELLYNDWTISKQIEVHEKYYKSQGWIFDEEFEEVYMIIEKKIYLNEGDRIEIHGKIRLVSWKCYNVIDDIFEYALIEE